jgi:PadR family transcriptional regulator PadR
MGTRTPKQDLLPGTLDMLILKALTRGVMHGYGVAEHIRQLSEDVLQVEEGSLYPALQRLQLQGLIASEWGHSVNNRRARYYRLTPAGRKHLRWTAEMSLAARRWRGQSWVGARRRRNGVITRASDEATYDFALRRTWCGAEDATR